MMRFIQSGSEARVYRTSSDDAENFLLNFLIYAQIANTDILMTTQNCTQNTAKLKVAVDH